MRLERIFRAVHYQPWLITPASHASIRRILESRMAMTAQEWRAAEREPGMDFSGNKVEVPQMTVKDGIAEIPVAGVIIKGATDFERGSGAVSTEEIRTDLLDALNRPEVRGIFLDIDSPGGTVAGVPELAQFVASVNEKKPVMAWTDGLMCSAAYWLGSQASYIQCAPTAEVGSIGVYMPWYDITAYYESMGVSVELIKNKEGTLKGMGYPGTSLTAEQRDELQRSVQSIYGLFSEAVDNGRNGRVPAEAKRGQSIMGFEAESLGLIDNTTDRERALDDLRALI